MRPTDKHIRTTPKKTVRLNRIISESKASLGVSRSIERRLAAQSIGSVIVPRLPRDKPPGMLERQRRSLRQEIEQAINRNCAENGSDTPDWILAEFIMDALEAFDRAVNARSKWYRK